LKLKFNENTFYIQKKRLRELSRTTTINNDGQEFTVSFDELEIGDFLGRGQFGTVNKMNHPPSNLTFAVKRIADSPTETRNDKRNSDIMDLAAPRKIGDSCPYLIKFYGALHAEVKLTFFYISHFFAISSF
jgi:hypothetical protein